MQTLILYTVSKAFFPFLSASLPLENVAFMLLLED